MKNRIVNIIYICFQKTIGRVFFVLQYPGNSRRFTAVSSTSCFGANVLSFRSRVGSVPKLLWPDQWLKERSLYMLIAFFCVMAERTANAQRSFHFLAERHRMLAKRAVTSRTLQTVVRCPMNRKLSSRRQKTG